MESLELCGLVSNLYSAQGFRLTWQDACCWMTELRFVSPEGHMKLDIRCVPTAVLEENWKQLEHDTWREEASPEVRRLLVSEGVFAPRVRVWASRRGAELISSGRLLRLVRRHLPGVAESLNLALRS